MFGGCRSVALRQAVVEFRAKVELEITGLRNPCSIDKFHPRLLKAVLDKRSNGKIVLRASVMTVVLKDGTVRIRANKTERSPPVLFVGEG